jgi:hypothetical protein
MIKRLAGLVFVLALAVLSGNTTLSGQDDTFQWSQRMTPGQVLEIRGISGEIRAVPAPGERAEVVARKRGDRGDFEEVAVEMAQAGDRIVICAVYGSWNHGQDRCHPDRSERGARAPEGRRNRSINVSVEFEVRVPAGVDMEGAMVSGEIRADGLRSDVSASTVSGPIRLSTTGVARANSVSGNLEIRMGDAAREDMAFRTVSGDITLWFPAGLNADVEFSSISGDLDSDFDLTIRSRRGGWVGPKLTGTIGQGGRELSLNTVSGDVRLRRGQG